MSAAAEAAIAGLMLDFGRALDRHDWRAYRACLADPLVVDFADLTGRPPVRVAAADWTEFARAALDPVTCIHFYSNQRARVRGARATGVCYMQARHWRARDAREYVQYGWYENDYVREPGGWRIATLRQRLQYCTGDPSVIDLAAPAALEAMAAVFGPAPAAGGATPGVR